MAIKICPECKEEVLETSVTCQKCGYEFEKTPISTKDLKESTESSKEKNSFKSFYRKHRRVSNILFGIFGLMLIGIIVVICLNAR